MARPHLDIPTPAARNGKGASPAQVVSEAMFHFDEKRQDRRANVHEAFVHLSEGARDTEDSPCSDRPCVVAHALASVSASSVGASLAKDSTIIARAVSLKVMAGPATPETAATPGTSAAPVTTLALVAA